VPHGPRVGVMMRSTNLFGPYEKKIILEDYPGRYDRQPNQGGLVQTEAGDWWFITQQGRGENGTYDGRPSHLLPVTWTNGWPVPGLIDRNGAGTILWSAKKPVNGFPIQVPQSDDEFSTPTLMPQWEWNYQPRADKWSLTERPGWLRLHAFQPLRPGDFFKAGNTLTQRLMGTGGGIVEVKLDASGMADGQIGGLVFYWKNYAQIGVTQKDGRRNIFFSENGLITEGPELPATNLAWVRAKIDDQGGGTFAYSLDGKTFKSIATRFAFGWHNYRGTRMGLFTYNDLGGHGHIDFDYFHYDYSRSN
jgi:beta-xylosidase